MMAKINLKHRSWYEVKDKLSSFLFILPAVTIFAVFYVYPFFETFNLSLRDWNGISSAKLFVGFRNFSDILSLTASQQPADLTWWQSVIYWLKSLAAGTLSLNYDEVWWRSVWHASYITLVALTFQNALAFMLAMACDREIRGKHFYRAVFFIPPVLSEVVVGLIWKWILEGGVQNGQHYGLLNHCLDVVGLHHLVNDWLSDPKTALTCIAVVHSWKGFGWGFLMFLAGLQTIDRELYEAAKVDGAGAWRTFWNITVPMMLPVIIVVVILTILGSMQAFVLILSMTDGGPGYHTEVPVTRILAAMMRTKEFGYACAMGVTFGAILIALSAALKKMENRIKRI